MAIDQPPNDEADTDNTEVTKYKGESRIKIPSGLTSFPLSILASFSTLVHLDLSNNPALSTLPQEFSRLHALKIAFFSNCGFKTWPVELSKCRSLEMIAFKSNGMLSIPEHAFPRRLRWLILTNNKLKTLPESIGSCGRLEKCMLAGNQLKALPEGMQRCRKLGLLRLSANHLMEIPGWVFEMPELAFLSFAGNPFCHPSPTSLSKETGLETIPWTDLEIQEVLGEGASGVISKAVWKKGEKEMDVAVKVFRGDCTSDGTPGDEMAAMIAAGKHPNLIDPLGVTSSSSGSGLVLQLIPPSYTNLGLPPTLTSCTRDAFPSGMKLSLSTVKEVLLGVASAAAHLHGRGIMHGDFYAHNILLDTSSGHALLGDFGAASVLGEEFKFRREVERMEVLGFGHLVEDLLGLVEFDGDGGEEEGKVRDGLNGVWWRCCGGVVGDRPGFEEVVEVLRGL